MLCADVLALDRRSTAPPIGTDDVTGQTLNSPNSARDVRQTPQEGEHPGRSHSSDRAAVWCVLSLVVLSLGLYWPVSSYGFLNWDDPWYVLNNSLIKSWHPANLFDVATRVAVRNYAPLTMFVLLVEHTLFGLWPGGYHITNMLLHAVNGVLVYVLLLRVTGSRFVGWTTAALFVVHPVQLESVAWISSQKGLLSGAFLLASLLCWLKPERTARDEAIGLAWYVLSLLAKALAIVQPPVVLAYDVLVRRVPFSQALTRQIIPGFCALLLLLVTMGAQTSEIGGVRGHLEWSKAKVVAVDAVLVWKYMGMLAAPIDLCVMYDPPTEGIWLAIVLAGTAWLMVVIGAWGLRKRYPLVPFALTAFFLFLFPVLNFFPITTLMNDRYLYIPCIPVFALAAGGIEHWLVTARRTAPYTDQAPNPRYSTPPYLRWGMAFAISGVMIASYAIATGRQMPVWESSLALWNHAYSQAPQLPVVRIQFADALYGSGEPEEAIAMLEGTLIETRPDEADRKRILRKLTEWRELSGRQRAVSDQGERGNNDHEESAARSL